ncbi:MAG: hypothetical protein ACHP8B_16945 [Terriglobales bacterium]
MPYSGWSGPRRFLLTMTVIALSASAGAQSSTQPKSPAADSTPQFNHVLGLEDVKHNANGKLTVNAIGLDFQGAASHAQIPIASIEDIFTGEDSHQTGGKVMTVAKMGVPYGGGRVLSLLTHEKFDSLTLEYRDENGGLHGALFTMPLGQATIIKKQLMARGAKASIPVDETSETKDAAPKEKK